jgi:alanyl-tRNA synthetase
MTEKLYLKDQYLQEFSSRVIQRDDSGKQPGIVLEQTLFYPTAGGQPHDTGTINGIPVVGVVADDSAGIVHFLSEPLSGTEVKGTIDWERRFDHMQQHTGQHLLSQAFLKTCDAQTLSFHMGDESATLDLDQAGFSNKTIEAVENLANRIIYENRRIVAHMVTKDELASYPVRKPPTVDDDIRIIEIEDFDFSPCGGTHCSKTGEIGIVKIRRFENYKGGARIHFLCGLRALKDYQGKAAVINKIAGSLSSGENDLYNNINKIQYELKSLQRTHGNLRKELIEYEAEALISECKTSGGINVIKKVFEDRDLGDLKPLATKILEKIDNTVILFGVETQQKASLLFMRSDEINCDMGKLMQDACAVINGRGGGRPQQAQGGGPAADKLDEAIQSACKRVSIIK